ncbi:MAG: outer membrane beta-barrel protein [Pseudomonadota bacterium]
MRTGFHRAIAFSAALGFSVMASGPAAAQDYGLYDGGSYFGSDVMQSDATFEGWWLGATVGGSTVNYSTSPGSFDSDGFIGGVIGGFSWQHGPFVIGLEADFMGTDIDGSGSVNSDVNGVKVGFDNLADLRMRLGYAFTNNLLLFGTFGGAWASSDIYMSGPGGGFRETDFTGWSIGGGAEYAFEKDWSLRFDYQFTDFGEETVNFQGGNRQTFDPDSNSFRGSVIYRF